MITFASSKDLLFLMLAISVAWITAFICWSLYEVGRMLHKMNTIVDGVQQKVESASQAIVDLKERIQSSANYFKVFSNGWKVLMGFLQERAEASSNRPRRKGKRRVEEDEDEEE